MAFVTALDLTDGRMLAIGSHDPIQGPRKADEANGSQLAMNLFRALGTTTGVRLSRPASIARACSIAHADHVQVGDVRRVQIDDRCVDLRLCQDIECFCTT